MNFSLRGAFFQWILLTIPLHQVSAELLITGVKVDGQSVTVSEANEQSSKAEERVRLTADFQKLRVEFTEDVPTSRLRYKLEGYDDTWQDISPKAGMKVSLQFSDADRQIVGNADFGNSGETPGWRGAAEKSDFESYREEVIVPERAVIARIVIYSQNVGKAVGVLGVDGVRSTIRSAVDGKEVVYDWPAMGGADIEHPMGTPENWRREGGRSQMAQLRTRMDPSPHRILVLYDNDPDQYAVWSTSWTKPISVVAGDTVILEWQSASSIGKAGPGAAEYENLKPGSYWFRVAAAKPNGELVGKERSVLIEILAPVYKRSEFWLLIAVLGLGLAAAVGRAVSHRRSNRRIAEVEHQNALERERSRIARDLHDDIGANLARIGMLAELVERSIDDPEKARIQLAKVFDTSKELSQQLDSVVWAVDPANDTLESFARFLHGHAEEYLTLAGLRCHFTHLDAFPDIPLPSSIRHHLTLLAKEALHNVVSHASARVVTINMELTDRVFVLEIEDDGKGLEKNPDGVPGDGLGNMQVRAEAIGGICEILPSRGDHGTLVRLEFPIKIKKSKS